MQHKLVFIETQDVVETTLALDNYRRACDCGRGAVFFSVARFVCKAYETEIQAFNLRTDHLFAKVQGKSCRGH